MADKARELCLRLMEETLERIRADRRRASVQVAKLLAVIEERLLDPNLDVAALLRDCGQRDKNISTRFATELIFTPRAYIVDARMELAGRLLTGSAFTVWRIGFQVGYVAPGSFNRAFKKWSGKTPTEFRKVARSSSNEQPPPALGELVSRQEIRQAVAGELPAERAEALAGRLYGLGDMVCAGYQQLSPPADGAREVEATMARNLWNWIESLPFEVQVQAVKSQTPRYRTLVLFNRLCTVSIEAEDGVSALKRATLAMTCLQTMGERVGENYLNVYARAYSVAGGAQCRIGQLEEAGRHFDQAEALLVMAGDGAHSVVIAELYFHRAMLEVEHDRFEEADDLAAQGTEILRRVTDQVLALQPTE